MNRGQVAEDSRVQLSQGKRVKASFLYVLCGETYAKGFEGSEKI